MAKTKAASAKQQDAEGVAVRVSDKPDRYAETGLPVSVPTDASAESESKSTATSATEKKEG